MVDFPKKKKTKKSPLGGALPPCENETKGNISQPELAPSDAIEIPSKQARAKSKRVIPFTTKFTEEFDNDLRKIAFEKKKTLGEVLEIAFYEWTQSNK